MFTRQISRLFSNIHGTSSRMICFYSSFSKLCLRNNNLHDHASGCFGTNKKLPKSSIVKNQCRRSFETMPPGIEAEKEKLPKEDEYKSKVLESSDTSYSEEDLEIIPGLEDPHCSESNPVKVSFKDVTAAAYLIKRGVVYTPCTKSHLSEMTGMDLYLKQEFLQHTGCFKERGSRYTLLMLPEEQKRNGIVSASMGNHAQGISYHGSQLGIPVTVVMPTIASKMKIERCKNFGGNVVLKGDNMSDARNIAMSIAKRRNMLYINGYDHPDTIAGQGSVGLEIIDQVGIPDVVLVPIGGGGLLAGVTTAIKQINRNTKIIGVESEKCPSFTDAIKNGGPILTQSGSTLADGLAVPTVGYNSYATAAPFLDRIVVVPEEWIALAILRLAEKEKFIVEGAGAIALGAIFSGQLDEFKGKKVVAILTGGNIDTNMLGRCLERGLAAEGRLLGFRLNIFDRPGGLADLSCDMAALGANIQNVTHERAFTKDIFSAEVRIVVETRDLMHSEEVRCVLSEKYKNIVFTDLPMGNK